MLLECRNHKNVPATIKDNAGGTWCSPCKPYATLMDYGVAHQFPELIISPDITLQAGEGIWKIRIPRLTLSTVMLILEIITTVHCCLLCGDPADYQDNHERYWCYRHASAGSHKLYSHEIYGDHEYEVTAALRCYLCENEVRHYDTHNRAYCHAHSPDCSCEDKDDSKLVEIFPIVQVEKAEQSDDEDYCACGTIAVFYASNGLPQCERCYAKGRKLHVAV